jgi:hypothetical protein
VLHGVSYFGGTEETHTLTLRSPPPDGDVNPRPHSELIARLRRPSGCWSSRRPSGCWSLRRPATVKLQLLSSYSYCQVTATVKLQLALPQQMHSRRTDMYQDLLLSSYSYCQVTARTATADAQPPYRYVSGPATVKLQLALPQQMHSRRTDMYQDQSAAF